MAGSLPLRPVLARGAMRYPGEVSERFKEHAWKVCVRQKRTEGSNPSLSASQSAVNGPFSANRRKGRLHPPYYVITHLSMSDTGPL
jgi:hypothetical protein